MEPSSPEGLVLRVDAKSCQVEVAGRRLTLPLAGKLFDVRPRQKRPLTVGDRVLLDATGNAIDALLPRTSQLHRRATSEGETRAQVIAANITLVAAVASIDEPPFPPALVDGVLAAAAREHIPAALVVTKVDRDGAGETPRWAALYSGLGYRVFLTSTAPGRETTAEFAELRALLQQNRTVLCGLSGVGKSTLLNAVVPGLALRTGALNHVLQGRHTTSHTELIPLPGGGHVLDTPGVRSFHLFHVGAQETQFLFPEIASRLPGCEYRSCLHRDEPGCAVLAARDAGAIARSRYASYSTMLAAALGAEHGGNDDDSSGKRRRGRRS